MSYNLMIAQKPAYLHATVTGLNTKGNVMGYLEEIFRECTHQGYFRVLIFVNGHKLDRHSLKKTEPIKAYCRLDKPSV